MCAWNCEGWLQKLHLKEVVCFLRSFDIFSLSETFVDSKQQYDSFCDYDVFVSKSTKLSLQGRTSGGVLIFVRKHLSSFIRHKKFPTKMLLFLKYVKLYLDYVKMPL